MPDYGRDLTFGYFLIPNAADPLLDTARDIEERGLDWIGIQDHPYQRRFVDTWTLMGGLRPRPPESASSPTWRIFRYARQRCWERRQPASTCSAVGGSSLPSVPAASGMRLRRTAGRDVSRATRLPPSRRRSRSFG